MTALAEAGRRQTQLQQIPRRAFSRTRNCWQPTTTVTDSAPRRVSWLPSRAGPVARRTGTVNHTLLAVHRGSPSGCRWRSAQAGGANRPFSFGRIRDPVPRGWGIGAEPQREKHLKPLDQLARLSGL